MSRIKTPKQSPPGRNEESRQEQNTKEKETNILLNLDIPKRQTQHQNIQLLALSRERQKHSQDVIDALFIILMSAPYSQSLFSHISNHRVSVSPLPALGTPPPPLLPRTSHIHNQK